MQVETCRYWGKSGEIAGLVKGNQVRGPQDIELEVEIQGTSTETILQWATGASKKVMGAQIPQGKGHLKM